MLDGSDLATLFEHGVTWIDWGDKGSLSTLHCEQIFMDSAECGASQASEEEDVAAWARAGTSLSVRARTSRSAISP